MSASGDDAASSGRDGTVEPNEAGEDGAVDGGDAGADSGVDSGSDADAGPIDCPTTITQAGSAVAGEPSTLKLTSSANASTVFSAAPQSGLVLNADGTITGSATSSGAITFEVTATWAQCVSKQSIVINVGCPTQSVTPASLPRTYEHASFTGVSLAHVGRVGASTFAVTSGAWPAGVTMAPDGTMGGSPAFGMSHVVVEARDAAGCKATVTYDFPVCRRHGWPAPAAWTKTNYPIGNDGWVNGKSVFLDKEKAAYFDLSTTTSTSISEISILVGKAQTDSPSIVIPIHVYDGTSGSPDIRLGGGAATMATLMADLQADRETTIPITVTTLPASKKFFVSVELTNLRWTATAKDVFSIFSNTDGQTVPSAIWEKQSNNQWYRYNTAASWKLDASLYVFPTSCP